MTEITDRAVEQSRHARFQEATNLKAQGKKDEAAHILQALIAEVPGEPFVHNTYAVLLHEAGKNDEAIKHAHYGLGIYPRDPSALNLLGAIYGSLADWDNALHYYTRAIDISPDFAMARWNRSMLQLLTGDWQQGWVDYEWGVSFRTQRLPEKIKPSWRGEALGKGRSICIWTEQGIGDCLMMVRFVKDVRERCPDARIVLEVHEAVLPLLYDFPYADRVVSIPDDMAFAEPVDTHCSLLSLPYALRLNPEDVSGAPYLAARTGPGTVKVNHPDDNDPHRPLRVGISWRGNPAHRGDKDRSIGVHPKFGERDRKALTEFCKAFSPADVQFFSLVPGQVGGFEQVIDGKTHHIPLMQGADLSDWMRTAAMLDTLGLVISVDTAVAHLAGAMGKPVWTLIPRSCDWRWTLTMGDRTLWYNSMRLFRGQAENDWPDVLERVKGALETKLQEQCAPWDVKQGT